MWKTGGAEPPSFQKWGSNCPPPRPPFSYPSAIDCTSTLPEQMLSLPTTPASGSTISLLLFLPTQSFTIGILVSHITVSRNWILTYDGVSSITLYSWHNYVTRQILPLNMIKCLNNAVQNLVYIAQLQTGLLVRVTYVAHNRSSSSESHLPSYHLIVKPSWEEVAAFCGLVTIRWPCYTLHHAWWPWETSTLLIALVLPKNTCIQWSVKPMYTCALKRVENWCEEGYKTGMKMGVIIMLFSNIHCLH